MTRIKKLRKNSFALNLSVVYIFFFKITFELLKEKKNDLFICFHLVKDIFMKLNAPRTLKKIL
jgi:hypothetical protein